MKKIISILLLISITFSTLIGCGGNKTDSSDIQSSSDATQTQTSSVSDTPSSEESSKAEASSKEESSKAEASSKDESSKAEVSSKEETSSKNENSKPVSSSVTSSSVSKPEKNELFPGYKYNTELDINNNVFLDALEYTGYNIDKHRQDGLMWTYILSNDKKHRGWLSNITYGGGCFGTEMKDGLPDIKRFEKGGLVCASFATYVYFNYLPNVAKIDTSSLARPELSYNADSFYRACKEWLKAGYTYNIGFTAKNNPGGIYFQADEEIPLGSIIAFRNIDEPGKDEADHITIYVGKQNGYHWVIQTGNKNGPEFCAVERFKFGPGPQWPLAIFATPTCIYDAINNPDKE